MDGALGRPCSIIDKSMDGSIPGGDTLRVHDIPQHLNSLHLDFKMACKHSPPKPKMLADSVSQNALSKVEYQGSDIFIIIIFIVKNQILLIHHH